MSQPARPERVCHLATEVEWLAAQVRGRYETDSLHTEGFIHCSTEEQVAATAGRYYAGRTDMVLLTLDTELLKWDLRFEESHGQLYPHLYGPIELAAVISAQALAV